MFGGNINNIELYLRSFLVPLQSIKYEKLI